MNVSGNGVYIDSTKKEKKMKILDCCATTNNELCENNMQTFSLNTWRIESKYLKWNGTKWNE